MPLIVQNYTWFYEFGPRDCVCVCSEFYMNANFRLLILVEYMCVLRWGARPNSGDQAMVEMKHPSTEYI